MISLLFLREVEDAMHRKDMKRSAPSYRPVLVRPIMSKYSQGLVWVEGKHNLFKDHKISEDSPPMPLLLRVTRCRSLPNFTKAPFVGLDCVFL